MWFESFWYDIDMADLQNETIDTHWELLDLSTIINENIKESNRETFENIINNTHNIIDWAYELSDRELGTISSLQAFSWDEMFSYLESIWQQSTIDMVEILFYKLNSFFIETWYWQSVPRDYIEAFSRILLKIPVWNTREELWALLSNYDELSRREEFSSNYYVLQDNLDILRWVLGVY